MEYLEPLADAFRSINSTLTFLLILGFVFLFTVQIIAWVTPPKPKSLHAVAVAVPLSALNIWAIYFYLPLAPALINASIVGVYDNWGYLWVFSLIVLCLVFLFNAIESWKQNKPIMELIQ